MKKVYLETPEAVIKALKEGKTVKCTDCGAKYTLENGFLVEKSKGTWTINPLLYGFPGYYTEEPDELKLEVGKFYRTRDGRKAWVVSRQQDEHYPYIIAVLDEVDAYAVTKDGRFYDYRPYSFDLVGPWEE